VQWGRRILFPGSYTPSVPLPVNTQSFAQGGETLEARSIGPMIFSAAARSSSGTGHFCFYVGKRKHQRIRDIPCALRFPFRNEEEENI
jgi:hypothetical protein